MADLGHIVRQLTAAADRERSDRELLERFAAAGDEAAFAALVQRHGPLVLSVCRRILQDGHAAEDALQATFLILARRAGRVRWGESIRSWLYLVAGRVARSARARRQRRQEQEREVWINRRAAGGEPTWKDLCGVLDEEIARLPEKERAVLLLCCLEGQARDEAAEQLGWTLNAVKKQLERGRDRLRQRLERRGLAFSAALLTALLSENTGRAALPALQQVAAVRAALHPESSAALSLAEGVMKTMMLNKIKWVGLFLFAAVVSVGGAAWYLSHALSAAAPSELAGPPALLEAKVSVSKPAADGIVTLARPLVANLAAGDPLKIILHWATENGPMRQGEAAQSTLQRLATLQSLRFTITTPDGKEQELRPSFQGQETGQRFYFQPTLLLALGSQGVKSEPLAGFPVLEGAWQGKPNLSFEGKGVYTIRIQGSRVMKGPDRAIPFETGPLSFAIGRDPLKPLDQVEAAARAALGKQMPEAQVKQPAVIHEGAGGMRLVRLATAEGAGWTYQEYTVEVKPDGTVGDIRQRPVRTCVARGTLVETDSGPRAIEAIREGDRLWGYDPAERRRVLTTVRLVRTGIARETLCFRGRLRVTAQHPLFVNASWREAGSVAPQDELLTADLRPIAAGSPQRLDEVIDVYDLTVDEPHCFFAGGFLVHNKDRDYWPHVDDIWYVLWPPPAK